MKNFSQYFGVLLFVVALSLVACKSDKTDAGADAAANNAPAQQVQPNRAQPNKVQPNRAQPQQLTNEQKMAQAKQRAQQQRNKYQPKVPGGKINWMTFEQAEKAMKSKPKKVFVDVYTEWCGWCKRLDAATFADKRVADYMNENYYAIKFDAQEPGAIKLGGQAYANPGFDASKPKRARNATHQLAQKYGARSYPTVLFLNEKFDLVQAVPGYRDADAFLPVLQQFNK